ncbi:MAG: hypothetical protein VR74_07415 [Hyphomonas sp. BRH_c22]|uniref:hypothetical protein n=1 Tax=Hyphomonas sp. BRH_c22 TaxID=1629710 RepID=UPI0005F0E686|nr:hypothetical protein [Hyphomonas sp. BRH_c22]KJS37811.1 MAG: hypothetical protein VR74_07415 [Hyphomonas sp. BRH_c22]
MTNSTKKLITELSDDYGVVVHALGRMTKNIGDHGDDAITESARGFVHAASKLADSLKQQTVNLAKEAGEEVREHPITAAALAAAAVGLLGFALTREHK